MKKYLSLKDHAYNHILEKISSGSVKTEEKIREKDICIELKLSRTPVREALIQLASEGYIEKLPRKGFIVRYIDKKKAADLYTIIGTLDALAASLAINSITENDIKQMSVLLEKMTASIKEESLDLYYKLQIKFHEVYINKCNNPELINLIKQLKNSFLRKSYTSNENQDILVILEHTNAEHQLILKLFQEGDAKKIQDFLQTIHFREYPIFYRSSIVL